MEQIHFKEVVVNHPSKLPKAILDALNDLHDKRIISVLNVKNDLSALIYFK